MIRIQAVIYDMDGLLLDTEPFYTEATQEIAGRYGKVFDWSVKSQMIGKRALDAAQVLVDALELPLTAEGYLEERKVTLDRLFPMAPPMPGAKELTQHLKSHNVPQAVASSSERKNFDQKISQHHEWFSIFDTIVLGDDPELKAGKPAPDIFLLAAKRLGVDPDKCIVFEDAPSGAEAGLRAGMQVAVVPDPNMNKDAYGKVHAVLSSLTEFQPEQWGFPKL